MNKNITPLIIGLAIISSILLSGCSSAGPFVTNITSDGQGNLLVEKSMIRCNWVTGTISEDPLSQNNQTEEIHVIVP